jgi:hypothetical protein
MLRMKSRLLGLATLAAAALPAANALATNYYTVTVDTNSGTTFTACFAFHGDASGGTLDVEYLQGPLYYIPAPQAPAPGYYTAVSSAALNASYGGTIAFSGLKMGKNGSITFPAVGSDYAHDSYYLAGTEISGTCSTTDAPAGGNPWKPGK